MTDQISRDRSPPPLKHFEELLDLMRTLRGKNGCAWNQAQTFSSLRSFLMEEAYETLDSLEAFDAGKAKTEPFPEAAAKLCDELGDLLLQIAFLAVLAEEKNYFSPEQIVMGIGQKLIRRHPHVFGDEKATTPRQVAELWEKVKAAERKERASGSSGALAGVPRSMPALMRAQKVGQKAAANRFDWSTRDQVVAKLDEEIAELKEALATPSSTAEIAHEIGDVLFTLTNLARFCQLQAEDVLHQTIERFQKRFTAMENFLEERQRPLADATLAEMEACWQKAKAAEK